MVDCYKFNFREQVPNSILSFRLKIIGTLIWTQYIKLVKKALTEELFSDIVRVIYNIFIVE